MMFLVIGVGMPFWYSISIGGVGIRSGAFIMGGARLYALAIQVRL